jgi:probable F420-dependent oxidoreductase
MHPDRPVAAAGVDSAAMRYALSVPLQDFTMAELPELARTAEALGYTDAWSGEVDGPDIFTPLAAIALGSNLRIGTAIVNVFNRSPQPIAASAVSLSELAPGRFILGVGAGSANIIERWSGIPFEKPVTRVREMVQVLKALLAGERVVFEGETIRVNGLRLSRLPEQPVPIHVAGLRGKMLEVAGAHGDGAILNWLSADDVRKSVAVTKQAAVDAGRDPDALEFSARLFVSLDPPDAPDTNEVLRRWVTSYLNVPTYKAFMEWLGHGPALQPMWDAWEAGDRKAAVANVPEEALREFFIAGTPAERQAHLRRYAAAGLNTAFFHFMTNATDPVKRREIVMQGIRDMAPPR